MVRKLCRTTSAAPEDVVAALDESGGHPREAARALGEGSGWHGEVCRHYNNGWCREGDACPYLHPGASKRQRGGWDEEDTQVKLLSSVGSILQPILSTLSTMITFAGTQQQQQPQQQQLQQPQLHRPQQPPSAFSDQDQDNCKDWVSGVCRLGERCPEPHRWLHRWGPPPHLQPISDRVPEYFEGLGALRALMKEMPAEVEMHLVVNGRLRERFENFRAERPDWETSWVTHGCWDEKQEQGFLRESYKEDQEIHQRLFSASVPSDVLLVERRAKIPKGHRCFLCKICHPPSKRTQEAWRATVWESMLPVFVATIEPEKEGGPEERPVMEEEEELYIADDPPEILE